MISESFTVNFIHFNIVVHIYKKHCRFDHVAH